jgi:hypothetical protein
MDSVSYNVQASSLSSSKSVQVMDDISSIGSRGVRVEEKMDAEFNSGAMSNHLRQALGIGSVPVVTGPVQSVVAYTSDQITAYESQKVLMAQQLNIMQFNQADIWRQMAASQEAAMNAFLAEQSRYNDYLLSLRIPSNSRVTGHKGNE